MSRSRRGYWRLWHQAELFARRKGKGNRSPYHTAERFFQRLGYARVPREARAPVAIQRDARVLDSLCHSSSAFDGPTVADRGGHVQYIGRTWLTISGLCF